MAEAGAELVVDLSREAARFDEQDGQRQASVFRYGN